MKTKPNFFVVGVVKGGTTSLYHYLAQHPEVYLPPIKETNHFAKNDIKKEYFMRSYARDVNLELDSYFKSGMKKPVHIAHVDDDHHYDQLFSKVKEEKAVGEISNSYMICPSTAKTIHDFNPQAKIVVILRNPITRVWSQYLMNLREAKSHDRDFITEMKEDHETRPKGWGINHQYLELGKYTEQLKRYIDLFGRDRVMVVFFEDYKSDSLRVLKRICSFLGVDSDFEFNFSKKSNASSLPRNATINKILVQSGIVDAAKRITPKSLREKMALLLYSDQNIPKLEARHQEWLRNYYSDEVTALGELLGKDVGSKWPQFK